ncbi:MAG TPA: M20/M25/M40 family metallo-hydrolase [Candidatus Dormibacteraeota bacterium]
MKQAIDVGAVHRHIDAHFDERVEMLRRYVRQPSVSTEGSGMRECAALVAAHYRELGCQEVEIVETETFPAVWAHYDAGAPRTIVNYNMYDVRSVGNRAAWTHDPFGADVEARGEAPAVLYGRGACVPKGPDVAWLSALASIRAVHGDLPVNVAFLAEGDEILGSPSYAGLIERYAGRIAGADGCVYLRAGQTADGELPLVLGYKAFLTIELRASGRRWGRGPVDGPAHSATASIVDGPAWRLARALATLVEEDGRIAIAGWPDGARMPEPGAADRALVDALLERFRGQPWADVIPGLAGTGVRAFSHDRRGDGVLLAYLFGSSLNIQGLAAGYTGPGTRTYTVPESASALLDARLFTAREPDELVADLRAHLDDRGFEDVELTVRSAYPACRTDPAADLVRAFLAAARRAGGRPVVWPVQGYGGPWAILARRFGMPLVFATGIGHGGNVGLPDEYLVLDGGERLPGLREMQRFCVDFVQEFAG